MALATLDEYEARHGSVPDADVVEALLEDASTLILDEVEGSEASWVTEAEPDADAIPRTAKVICIEAAFRAYMNPGGLSRVSLGETSHSFNSTTPDALFLTEDEKRRLRRIAKRGTFRSATLTTPYSGTPSSDLDFDFPLDS
jgi:hypothetical protein